YLRRANVNQLVINPLLVTDRLLDLVRSTPGVENVSMSTMLNLETDDIDAAKQAEFGDTTQPLGSVGGRYIDVDRPTVIEGRMLSAENEIFVNRGAADHYDLHIGDEISVTFVPAQPNGPPPNEHPTPIGHERLKVVGIGVFADEVLPDDLYANVKIVFSPQLTAKYSCVTKQPEPNDPRSIDELNLVFFPPNCSSDATLLSLRLTKGDAGVADVLASLDARIAAENARLPAAMREQNFGFQIIPTVTSAETERVRRSVEPVVLALRLLGLASLGAAIVLAGATAHRTIRGADAETKIWSQLGVARPQRMMAVAALTAVSVVAGLLGALAAGWLASGIGPVASVSVLDPQTSFGIPAAVLVAVLPGALVVLLALLTLSAWRATSIAAERASRDDTNWLADAAAKTGDVPLALGVHAAVRGRNRSGSGMLIGASIVAIAIGTGGLVYSTNLLGLVSHPPRYGWTYDVGATINAGFDGADPAQIETSLARPEVAGWGAAATALTATIDGVKLPAIADLHGLVDLGLPTLRGALPRNDHEVALGSTSAKRIGVSVGDHVAVETDFGERDATVTGIVVLPAIGAFLSDRAGLGTGILMSTPFFHAVVSAAEEAAGVPSGQFYDTIGGFLAIDLHEGIDARQFINTLGDGVLSWDRAGRQPSVHVGPVRPAQIADIASIRTAPPLLAALIALTMIIGLVASLGRAIRTRRRELAVLRALGCRASQIYATLCWQALTVVAIGLVVGVPLGVIAGSALWRSFAGGLGIVAAPTLPSIGIGVVIGAAIVVTICAALPSGRRAAAERPAAALRES
ncbi:MAG: FtsX-like permease family protein, partial [Ilumatobacteraceae bacterium]|nr:FtsX-like permease family protein [Ilumatobacteraceae bacterium]